MIWSKIKSFIICLFIIVSMAIRVNAHEPEEIKFGIIPLESSRIMYYQFLPLSKYLSEELGVNVKLVVGLNYQDTMDALGKNEVQIAYLTPTTYPKCEKQNPDAGIKPIVRFQLNGKGTYRSCIIVPTESKIDELSDLKGKTFAFGSTNSTSSHLMPRAMLVQSGIDIDKDLASYKYLGSHTNVAIGIKWSKYDAGGVKESVAEKYQNAGTCKIIAKSKDIPEFPICVNKYVDVEMVEKIEKALLELKVMDSDDCVDNIVLQSINKKYTGCEPARSKDYDSIRDMIADIYGDDFYKRDIIHD